MLNGDNGDSAVNTWRPLLSLREQATSEAMNVVPKTAYRRFLTGGSIEPDDAKSCNGCISASD
jgi:hypothetical protein